jgi:hypothetical protein
MSDQAQITSETIKFFSDYTKLFDARDGASIATYYYAPSISMRSDASVHVFQSHQEVRDFFQGVAEKYYAEGQRGSRFVDLDVKLIGSKSVLATLEWQMLREDGSIIRKWRQSYNLIRPADRWQILASTAHI